MNTATADLQARIIAALDRLAGDLPAMGLAVSGGGDSVALMHMVADWAASRRVMVATVDHGLRAESTDEARQVNRTAKVLGLDHTTLRWQPETDTGNMMANARDARLQLLSDWARQNDLPAVLLAHTADDVAETLMMRLARGSGIDGLAGMAEYREAFGMVWIRPMLQAGRTQLRDWMQARSISWIDDPSNDNEDYERVRIRKAMATLGIKVDALVRSAGHIREARNALSYYASVASDSAIARNGTLLLPRLPFREAPPEIARRLLIAGCRWITGADYPPRRATVMHAMAATSAGSRVTLDGALIDPSGDRLSLSREPAAALRAETSTGPVWDNRWRIDGLRPGQHVAALGTQPLLQLNWRASGLSRDETAASPAIWQGGTLIAAPLLRRDPSYRVTPLRGAADFRRMVMAH